jgi:5'-3' exonuclease
MKSFEKLFENIDVEPPEEAPPELDEEDLALLQQAHATIQNVLNRISSDVDYDEWTDTLKESQKQLTEGRAKLALALQELGVDVGDFQE